MAELSESGPQPPKITNPDANRAPAKPAVAPPILKPKIGDSRPAPASEGAGDADSASGSGGSGKSGNAGNKNSQNSGNRNRNRNRNRGPKPADTANGADTENRSNAAKGEGSEADDATSETGAKRGGGQKGSSEAATQDAAAKNQNRNRGNGGQGSNDRVPDGEGESKSAKRRRRRRRNKKPGQGGQDAAVEAILDGGGPVELSESEMKARRGRSRDGKPIGRYMMAVSKKDDATHIAVLEGRNLIEYYVSHPSDDEFQIHGNIYLGRVQNVLPGMEAAFVDISTSKNAVLYRGDVQYDKEDMDTSSGDKPKIEQMLKPKQMVLCQVTKNPIAHKGARLTTEVSLPGRFVVLVPNSDTYGISKRLPDTERKRLRQILDKVKPKGHGVIVRTAAENITAAEIERDVLTLAKQWEQIDVLAKKANRPTKLYQEPDMSVRVIREEFNKEYRTVAIDDEKLFNEINDYVSVITPALADRVKHYDLNKEPLGIFERHHVHEQLHKALDRKVWLPSGGSLIIEGTEALTVIDVNTGKNVGSSSLEDTVYQNNVEAAIEVAKQLRLRDIGGIIVIDFVDMENRKNRAEVIRVFREALSRDKTRTQVYEISDLGLAEMTRKRIGEGLLESLSNSCPHCEGKGVLITAPGLNGAPK